MTWKTRRRWKRCWTPATPKSPPSVPKLAAATAGVADEARKNVKMTMRSYWKPRNAPSARRAELAAVTERAERAGALLGRWLTTPNDDGPLYNETASYLGRRECFACGRREEAADAFDTCPLCLKIVCGYCAEREGGFCCDDDGECAAALAGRLP